MPGLSSISSRFLEQAQRLARALLCGGTIVFVTGYGWLHVAHAALDERLRGFGAELASWPAARAHSPPRRLFVNGLELGLLTLSTSESVHQTLDRFHAHCRARAGIAAPSALKSALASSLLDGTFREESASEGIVACLDTERPLDLDELIERLRVFGDHGDLAALGDLRYTFARRDGSQTAVISLWIDGPAKLFELFPKVGDAPGRDPRGVPRPPASRRLLSCLEHGLPYSLTLYEVARLNASELGSWYESAFVAAGWTIISAKSATLMVRQGERILSIQVSEARQGQTMATVVELS